MSHEHSIKGINIFPNPPIKIGIIIKNIINTPWKVIHELYCREEHIINPGKANSNLTINDSEDPIIPCNTLLIILLLSLITSFIGYTSNWGQMSYWGMTVIISILHSIPIIGDYIAIIIWPSYIIGISRLFTIHFIIGYIMCYIIFIHIIILHAYSSSNTLINNSSSLLFPFYCYFFKDVSYMSYLLLIINCLLLIEPDILGNCDNNLIADPFTTPHNILPEWYSSSFHCTSRSYPNKNIGVIIVIILFILLFCFSFIFILLIIYCQDYLSNIIESILITLYSINKVVYSSLLSFIFLNIGCTALYISIKIYISISIIVGNIIDIYIYGLITVLISSLLYYLLYGIIWSSFLLYLFLTKIEYSLFILFYMESFSSLFQSITLANRLVINLFAGSLLVTLLSITLHYSIYYLLILLIITVLLFIVFTFEMVNSCIQLFIFSLLTIEYLNIISSLLYVSYSIMQLFSSRLLR